MIGLIHSVNIMTEDESGLFTETHTSGLPCRLAHQATGGATGQERAELSAMRRLIWNPTPALPEAAQVVTSEGIVYNVVAGSMRALHGPTGAIVYRTCDIVRAVDG